MTETSPLAVRRAPAGAPAEGEEHWDYRSTAGRLMPLVRGARSSTTTATSVAVGRRGDRRARRCAGRGSPARTTRTRRRREVRRRLAAHRRRRLDRRRAATSSITDRSKDVIKSGGEWISSVELENELMGHPTRRRGGGDRACPTSAGPSARSPASCSRRARTSRADGAARVPRRRAWRSGGCPTTFAFIDEVPKTSVGKFDKKVLRKRLEEGELETVSESEPASRSA